MGVTDEYGYTQQYNIRKGRYTNMKRTINTTIIKTTMKTIKTIITIGFIVLCICLLDSMQVKAAEPVKEIESLIDMNQISDFVVNGECLQLYFNDGNGYYWELETGATIDTISNEYAQYDDSYIDMNTVTRFDITEYGLMFYFSDGNGYYWEW